MFQERKNSGIEPINVDEKIIAEKKTVKYVQDMRFCEELSGP